MAHAFTLACLMAALLAGWAGETAAAAHITGHDVALSLDPAAHELRGRDTLTLSDGGTLTFLLHEGLTVARVTSAGRELKFERTRTGGQFSLWEVAGTGEGSQVLVDYGGPVYAPPQRGAASRHGLATETSGLIAPEGLFLPRPWAFHPWQPGERARLRVAVETPAGYEAVSVGRLAARTTQDGRTRAVWEAEAGEAPGFLIGGPLTLHEERAGGVAIYLYFYAEDADLAPAYAARLRELVPLYTRLLGPFPYPKFAVVENFFPTGLGFPSLTLLGKQVVRLPFILEGSLAHELVHSWWGGSVEWKDGNWVEGLTAYLSDYYLTERQAGAEAAGERRRLLEQFSVYAPRLKEPLMSFQEPGPRLSDALGYTKGALVFHQLRREVGEGAFFAALRLAAVRYRGSEASWNELRGCFEEVAGRPLGWFFEQWVERPGAPRLSIGGARVERAGEGGWRVSAALSQRGRSGKSWRLKVPVVLEAEDGSRLEQEVALGGERAKVEFSSPERPVRLVVDPEAHVLRELGPSEIPARLSLFFAAPERAYVLPAGPLREAAGEAAQALSLAEPGEVIEAQKVRRNGPAAAMFLGSLPEPLAAEFPGSPQPAGEGFTFRGQTYPQEASAMLVSAQGPQRVRVLVYGRSREGLLSAARFLPHLGRYGWAVFAPGERPLKGEPEPARWLSLELAR